MIVRSTFPTVTLLLAATLLGVGLVASCSSSDSTRVPVGLYGEYVANGDVPDVGGIAEIQFLDSEHYSLERTSGGEDYDDEAGTYELNPTSGMLLLHNAATGETEALPFRSGTQAGAPFMEQSEDLHLLDGLTSGGTVTLAGSGGQKLTFQIMCTFTLSTQGASTPGAPLNFQNVTPTCTLVPGSGSGSGGSGSGAALTTPEAGVKLTGDCAPIVYKSDTTTFATIQTVANATVSQSYVPHGVEAAEIPHCFIDIDNVVDATTNKMVGKNVKVSEHYTLAELTQTGPTPDRYVLLDPGALRALEKFLVLSKLTSAPTVTSGFRAPQHQQDTCEAMCHSISCSLCRGAARPQPQRAGCPVTCAKGSRHMFGKAFDLSGTFLRAPYPQNACTAGFTFVFNESAGGPHLHIDTSFPAGSCVREGV